MDFELITDPTEYAWHTPGNTSQLYRALTAPHTGKLLLCQVELVPVDLNGDSITDMHRLTINTKRLDENGDTVTIQGRAVILPEKRPPISQEALGNVDVMVWAAERIVDTLRTLLNVEQGMTAFNFLAPGA